MKRSRIGKWAAGLAALGAPLVVLAAQTPKVSDTTTVVAVEVPVQVLVDGKPVRGLTAADFELLDGRKAQRITGFEVQDLSTAVPKLAATPAVAPSARRHFLILFDLANSDPAAVVRARAAAQELVEKDLHPSDLVGVATYTLNKGPQLLLGFTTDRRQIQVAIDTLGVPQLFDRLPDPLALQLADLDRAAPAPAGQGGANRGDRDAIILENLKDDAAVVAQANRENQKAQAMAFTRGFGDLGKLMGRVNGRKYVVFLSQGFDASVFSGSASVEEQQEDAQDVEFGESYKVDSEQRFGSTQAANQLSDMVAAFRQADCVIQSVDIGGLAAAADQRPRANGRDTLFTMAKDTGGQLFENFNNLAEAMNDVLESTSVTYVLTFQPENLKNDGKYHPIKVKLKNAPSGARIVQRQGYYAPTGFAQMAGIEKKLDTAQLLLAGELGGNLVGGATLAPFREAGPRAHVPVIVQLDGPSLLAARTPDNKVNAFVYIYAIDGEGAVRDFVAQPLALDLAQLESRLKSEGMKFAGDLLLAPGDYAVRVLVRAGERGDYFLDQIPLTVPDFAAGGLAALPPLFPEAMTRGVVVRASNAAEKTKGMAFPFAVGQEYYLPNAMPKLVPGTEAQAIWVAYNLAQSDLQVSGSLETEDGRPVPGSEVRLVERTKTGLAGLDRLRIGIKAGSGATGPCVVRLHLAQGANQTDASARVQVGS
ncbi:MAG: VWA domain-containing protein [Thermoanaerobaculia bacterium]